MEKKLDFQAGAEGRQEREAWEYSIGEGCDKDAGSGHP
jgi:hypothetical protein